MVSGRFSLALAAAIWVAAWALAPQQQSTARGGANLRAAAASGRLIVPGRSAGPVRLGDGLADLRRMLRRTEPSSLRPYLALHDAGTGLLKLNECGKEIDTVSWGVPWPGISGVAAYRAGGRITVYLIGGRVVLISSGVALYHTAHGLTAGSTPQQVQRLWPNLRAYEDNATSMALNNRPVIYWVSQAKGIAFAFASDGPRMGWTRSLDSIEVFRPGWKFQPHGCAWPGEWSPLPPGTIHLRHQKPNTRIALGPRERGPAPADLR